MGEQMSRKILDILVVFSCMLAVYGMPVKKPQKTPQNEAAVETWEKVFLNKPIESLEDPRVLVRMFLLSPYGKNTVPARDMGLADIVVSKFGTSVVRETVTENALLNRASFLKGGELTETESKAVRKIVLLQQQSFNLSHPNADKFSFLIKDDAVNLHLTIKDETNMEKALASIARQHGLVCNYRLMEEPSAATLWLLLESNNPVLLEEKDTGRLIVAFGMWQKNGADYICMNDITNTSVVSSEKPSQLPVERESIQLFVINSYIGECRYIAQKTNRRFRLAKDFVSDGRFNLPQFGFELTRYEPSRYRAHVMTDWRKSAEAWDAELRVILNLKEPPTVPVIPSDNAPFGALWKYYFQGHPVFTGSVLSGMTPLVLWRSKTDISLCATMVSLIAACDANPWAWTLTANKMWLAVRDVPANDLLLPNQTELDALVALDEECGRSFRKRFEAFTGVKYSAEYDFKAYDAVLVVDGCDTTRTGEWILSQIGTGDMPEEVVRNYTVNTGKIALLEGGHPYSWQVYQRAILRNIPILLHTPNADDWRIAFGFLEHAGKRLLLTATQPTDWKEDENTRQIGRNMPMPKEVRFEEFDENAFIPFFIHKFKPDISSVKDRINDIFKGNPSALPLP